MKTKRRLAQELRQAVDCLPERTREAMLVGLDENEIIVGAYTDRSGRVCPMLAAHRHGGRTSLATFAKAWDRYTGAGKRPRPATRREVTTLRSMLEASLMWGGSELETAAADHQSLVARGKAESPKAAKPDTGERSRLKELGGKPGWSWLRVFRRYDDFQAALAQVESEEKAKRHADERERVG